MPNVPQFIIAYYGLLKAGAVIVMLNPLSTQDQLKHNFADSGAKIVVTIPLFLVNVVPLVGTTPLKQIISSRLADFLPFPLSVAQRVQEMRLCRPFKNVPLIDFQRLIGNDAPADFRPAPVDPDGLALLIYTSGTTGAAKGIMLSHFNCVASAYQLGTWVQLTDDDRIMSILPLFHIFGMTVTMNVPIMAGIETILEPRFEVREIIKAIQKYRPTFFTGIPNIFVAFNHLPDIERYDLSSLRCIFVGGAPLPQAIKEIFEAKTGARMIEGYGQTEATPVTATPSQGMHKPGSAGIPFPDVEVKIVSLDDGRRLPILPLINNYLPAASGTEAGWKTDAVARLLASATSRARFIGALREKLAAERWQGVTVDFEEVAPADRDRLTALMRELSAALTPEGLLVAEVTQVGNSAFDLPRLAASCDFVMPMLYDEHWGGPADGAGSIAGIPWTRDHLAKIFAELPPDKVVVGLGNYAYDWADGAAEALTYAEALARAAAARARNPAEGQLRLDPRSLNPMFRYTAAGGATHVVWLLDAMTAYNQWTVAGPSRPRGAALWRLGAEDPSIWQVIGRSAIGGSAGSRAIAEELARTTPAIPLAVDPHSGLLVVR